ncbi:aldo-keto reductase AKR2E4-like [Bombyx mandarina]|uniref:Aldo-keto reductase AKR2E4-like n=1 Tax=Bombyx mandarina TaxID=7092 RepID=A0A6J2K026_BOMMA|nr:aldo-keto reductase AKR2E4-like [Bombyx mandarina]
MRCIVFVITTLIVHLSEATTGGGKAPKIPLNDGNSIPALGLGTFLGFSQKGQKEVKPGDSEKPVKWALEAGYRLIDTAALYLNEDQIGAAVRASGIPREDIFIVTKLPMDNQRDVVKQLEKSLARLNMSYVDLYLIHNPVAFNPGFKGFDIVDYLDTWKGMEEAKNLGLAKSIGISNFNTTQIDRILENGQIKPSVLQVEVNLHLGQDKLIDYCKRNGIVVMAFSPFGPMFHDSLPSIRPDDPTLVAIAEKHGKSVTQIVLRYLIQKGVVPIPKSVKKNRIEENIDVFDFNLSSEDMNKIGTFNKEKRTVGMSFWQDHPYYPFEKSDQVHDNPFESAN